MESFRVEQHGSNGADKSSQWYYIIQIVKLITECCFKAGCTWWMLNVRLIHRSSFWFITSDLSPVRWLLNYETFNNSNGRPTRYLTWYFNRFQLVDQSVGPNNEKWSDAIAGRSNVFFYLLFFFFTIIRFFGTRSEMESWSSVGFVWRMLNLCWIHRSFLWDL